jgi:hypothetical protein
VFVDVGHILQERIGEGWGWSITLKIQFKVKKCQIWPIAILERHGI